jgi:hypothetical protein
MIRLCPNEQCDGLLTIYNPNEDVDKHHTKC